MMSFVQLIPLDRCRRGGGVFVARAGRGLAVFLLDCPQRVFVVDDTCPHAGGSLASGSITGHIVRCPYHHWQFDLHSGACMHNRLARVRVYDAEIRGGGVWADLPDDP